MKTCTCEAPGVQGTCVLNSLLVYWSAGMMILTLCVCIYCVYVCVCMCIVYMYMYVCTHACVRAVRGGGCIYRMAGNFRGSKFSDPDTRSRAGRTLTRRLATRLSPLAYIHARTIIPAYDL